MASAAPIYHRINLSLTVDEAESLLAVLAHVRLGMTGRANDIGNILGALEEIPGVILYCNTMCAYSDDDGDTDGLEFIDEGDEEIL